MKRPRIDPRMEFVCKFKMTTADGASVTHWNTKGTKSAKPAEALARILEYSFIFYGVPWMEAQFAKAKAVELKRAARERRHATRRGRGR